MDKILIAAASPQTKDWIVRALSPASLTLDNDYVASPSKLKAALRRQVWTMILLDTALLPLTVDEILQQTLTPVFLLADHPTTAQTVDWMRAGARGVIEKNDADMLLRLVKAELQATSPSNPLNQILDTIQETIYSYSVPDYRIIYKSASFEKVFGYPLESFLEDPEFYKKVVHPDDLPAAIAAMQKGRSEGFVEADHRIILPDGQIRWLHRRVWITYNQQGEPIVVNDSSLDITPQKIAEEALRLSEERLRTLLENMQDVVWSAQLPEFQITYLNPAVRTVYQRQEVEFYADSTVWSQVVHPEDRALALASEATLLQEGRRDVEYRILRADGEIRWLHDRAWVVKDDQGNPRRVEGVASDITRQKQAEEALRQSEANFRTLFNTVQDFLFVLDMQGNIQEVNQTVIQRLGYTQAELMNQSVLLVHPPDRHEEALQILGEMLQGTKSYCPVPLQTKAGRQIPVETYVTEGIWNGQPAVFGVSKDISALKRSEAKFAAIFQANPAIVGLSKIDTGHYVEVNPAFCEKLGFTPEEVIGKRSSEVVRLDEKFRATTIEKLKTQGYVRGEEAVIYTKDGTPLPVLLYADLLTINDEAYNFTIAVDITNLKNAEAAARQSADWMRLALQATDLGKWQHDVRANIFRFDERAQQHYGLETEAISLEEISERIHPDDTTRLMAEIVYTLSPASDGRYQTEYRVIHFDGSIHWLAVQAQVYFEGEGDSKRPVFGFGTSQDITRRKQVEENLRASEEKYRSLIESSDAAISMIDADGRYLYLNTISALPYGVPPEALVGKTVHELFPPDQANQILRDVQQVIAQETGLVLEPEVTINGRSCWFRTSIQPVRDGNGTTYAAFIHASEITSQKEAELALRTSEERYRNVIENQTEMVCRYDAHLRLKFGNVAYCKNYGVSPDEIVGKSILDKIPPEEHPLVWEHLRSLTRENPVAISVHQSIQADGSVHWTEWSRVGMAGVTR